MSNHQNTWCIILGMKAEDGGSHQRWPKIEQELQKTDISYSIRFAEHEGHATRLTDDAILKGYEKILGIGNQSLQTEINRGITENKHTSPENIQFAMLPFGFDEDLSKPWRIGRVRAMLKKVIHPL